MRKLIGRLQSLRRPAPQSLAWHFDVVAQCHEEMALIAERHTSS